MNYTETELAKLIETVESEFTAHLTKAEALAKSEDAPPKKEEKPEDKKPEAEAKPAAEGKAPEAAPAEAKPAPEAAAAPAAAAPAAAAPAEDHGYDPEDMQHMDQMYSSMSPAELKAHHDSIRKCLDAKGGAQAAPAAPAPAAPGADAMGKSEAGKSEISAENPVLNSKPKAGGKNLDSDPKNGGIEGQQPSGSPGAKSPASDASKADQMAKAEAARRNGGKIEDFAPRNSPGAKSPASKAEGNQMEKSENTEFELLKNELEAEKAKGAELKKNFDAAQEFVAKLVSKIAAPKAKAITEIASLAKNEGGSGETPSLSKAEITEKLFRKSSDPKLEKSDRDAINKFYDGGQININSISHLLK